MSKTDANPRVARLAHDVANALARAVSRLSLLAERDLPPDVSGDVHEALEAMGEAREGLREILESSRGEERARFSLLDAWRRAAGAPGAPASGAPADDAEALADPAQVSTILASIVGTERATAGSVPALEARVERLADRVVLVVRSPAPPFSATELAQLQDPFFLKKPDGFGEGVGFAICQRIAARNGGAFAVDEAEGGRRYRLELPVAPRRPAAGAGAPEAAAAPAPAAAASPARCLVVDDDARVRESCTLMLRHLGFTCTPASTGREALDRLAAEPFEVVLLDLNLGKPVDGDQVLEELERTRPDLLGRTLIATGDPTSEFVTRFSARLGVSVLPKPFGVEELRTRLAGLTRK